MEPETLTTMQRAVLTELLSAAELCASSSKPAVRMVAHAMCARAEHLLDVNQLPVDSGKDLLERMLRINVLLERRRPRRRSTT